MYNSVQIVKLILAVEHIVGVQYILYIAIHLYKVDKI